VWELLSLILLWVIAAGSVSVGALAIWIWSRNLTRKMSLLRVFTQIIATIAIFVLLLFIPLPWNPILSGLTYSIALRLTIIFIMIAVSSLVIGRFFCGWLCPFALYMDLITRIRKALKLPYWNLPESLNNALNYLRYLLLASIIISALILGVLYQDVWRFVIMFMGPFKPLIIVFLTPIEPLVTQLGGTLGFEIWGTSFHDLAGTVHYFNGELLILITWIVFFAFTAISFMVRLSWCRFCPAGITLTIVNKFKAFKWLPIMHINKVEEKCTKCGICKRVCPVQITEVYEEKGGNVTVSKCIHCFRCVEMCPYEGCLNIKFAGKKIYKSKNWLKEEEK
jgi:polyferredoxin